MGVRRVFEVRDGWAARGFVFEVETTSLEQPALRASVRGEALCLQLGARPR
jgi:hypothetical protein